MLIAHIFSGVTRWYHDIEGHERGAIDIEALYRFLSVSHFIWSIFPLREQRAINVTIHPSDWIDALYFKSFTRLNNATMS